MDISTDILKLAPWSISMASTATTCAHAFHNKYTRKIKEAQADDTAAALVGTVIHKVLELAVQKIPFEKAWATGLESYALTMDVKDQVLTFRTAVEDFLERIEKFKKNFGVTTVIPERKVAITPKFSKAGFFDKGGLLRGVVDLTLVTSDGRVVVIDHKTGAKQDISKHAPQLESYAVMLQASMPGIKSVRSAIHYVGASPDERGSRTVWAAEYQADEIINTLRPRVIQTLQSAADSVSENQEPNKDCWLCRFCGYKSTCPAYT